MRGALKQESRASRRGRKRIEEDSLGKVEIPADKYWGAQTQRSLQNFAIGQEKMPLELVHALALVKKAAAHVNCDLKVLSKEKRDLITFAVDEILKGKWDSEFPLSVWQTGSGTQTNMNVNEVISNIGNVKAGSKLGSKSPLHPNDDVNASQSSNDVFPTAMHIAASFEVHHKLIPHLEALYTGLKNKTEEFKNIVKVGRTHLMDATPLTLGQEFSGYAAQIEDAIHSIKRSSEPLQEIALGGSAVGTGINVPKGYAKKVAEELSELIKLPFKTAHNKFEALASNDDLVDLSGSLKRLACALMKIANDIRWMASGPRCGLSEISIPANEPGSSIMPGKVNPTQSESVTMVATQVMGNDAAIAIAASMGNFELNVFKPAMIYNLLQSIRLLADVSKNFLEHCIKGIEPNLKQIETHLSRSLMLATALNPHIGYDKAALVVKKAYKENITLKEAAVSLRFLTQKQFDELIDPRKMV